MVVTLGLASGTLCEHQWPSSIDSIWKKVFPMFQHTARVRKCETMGCALDQLHKPYKEREFLNFTSSFKPWIGFSSSLFTFNKAASAENLSVQSSSTEQAPRQLTEVSSWRQWSGARTRRSSVRQKDQAALRRHMRTIYLTLTAGLSAFQ